jgi:DNA segregation ATPase FtsK/SpoIIIE-like protein
MTNKRDHYETLQVRRDADSVVIRAAYRALAQANHPDRNSDRNAGEEMTRINDAYAVLIDHEKRARYDQELQNAEACSDHTRSCRADNNGPHRTSQDSEVYEPTTDPLYDEACVVVLAHRRVSISFLQRQLRIGYNRSARLIELMEAAGLVSAMDSDGGRTVLADDKEDEGSSSTRARYDSTVSQHEAHASPKKLSGWRLAIVLLMSCLSGLLSSR